jgi:hypothetical protein
VLDFVEEPFDQIPGSIEMRAKADRLVAIASRRNVGPNAPVCGKGPDPVGVISPICQQHCPRLQARQKFACEPVVVCFSGCQREPNRQAVDIDQRMNLTGQPAPATVPLTVFCSG